MGKWEELVFLLLFSFMLSAFIVAGFLVYFNPIAAFSIKYAGLFNSYYYSDFFALMVLGGVIMLTYRPAISAVLDLRQEHLRGQYK